MIRSHKIRLFPTVEQEVYLRKACGVSRFAYNWALARWREGCDSGEKVDSYKLKKELNAIKQEQFPWMYEVTKCAPEAAVLDLGRAFTNFFKGLKQGRKVGYPKFKKKGVRDSFYVDNRQLKLVNKSIKLPKLSSEVRMAVPLRFTGKIMSGVVSRDVDRWYISVAVETWDKGRRKANLGSVGIDLGVCNLAILSNGVVINNPRWADRSQKRLARAQRSLSRKTKRSSNRAKAKLKVARLHRRIRLQRNAHMQQVTSDIARKYNRVVVEDLNVAGMVRNHNLARVIFDAGFGKFITYLDYKQEIYDFKLIRADRFYPSSKTCSSCGEKKDDLRLNQRTFRCDSCGLVLDRDLNAARNLKALVPAYCREFRPAEGSPSPVKQEVL